MPQCRLRDALQAARNAFLAELDRYTIGEVTQPHAPLRALLGLGDVIPIVPVVPAAADDSRAPLS